MKFSVIPGHIDLKRKLSQMFLNNRIGHAITIAGEEGSANLAIAISFAQYMCCQNRTSDDSCGSCPSCIKFEKNIHPDVHFYFPTITSSSVPKNAQSFKYLEKWRNYLSENMFVTLTSWIKNMDANKKEAFISAEESLQIIKDLSLKSFESSYRYAIIWLPERLNIHSSNKLLKIIEEPPKGVYFFLVTENPELVLPTILSRTQVIRIGSLNDEEMIKWVSEYEANLSPDQVTSIVRHAEGNPFKALSYLNNESDNSEMNERFISWARLCYKASTQMPELIDFSENLSALNREDQKSLIDYGLSFFRNSILINNQCQELIISESAEEKSIINFAPLLNPQNCSALMAHFDKALKNLERYANTKILFLNLSLNLAKNINAKNVNL